MEELFFYSLAASVCWIIVVSIWMRKFFHMETLIHAIVAVGVALTFSLFGLKLGKHDVALYTSYVESKYKEKVDCDHSYVCNCRETCTGSGTSRSCSTTCDTCYEHSYDMAWRLKVAGMSRITIDNVSRQGLKEPPRWTAAQIGDPVTAREGYRNWVASAPESIFNESEIHSIRAQYENLLPEYPRRIYDYHYNDKVVAVNLSVPDIKVWNRTTDELLKKMSLRKNVNMVNVFVKGVAPNYADALAAKWYGGKHNDVLVVTGVDEWPKVAWVRVISWTDNDLFKVTLRDKLATMDLSDPAAYLGAQAQAIDAGYTHKDPEDFSYLKSFIKTPMWVIVLAVLANLLANIAVTVVIHLRDWRQNRATQKMRNSLSRRYL